MAFKSIRYFRLILIATITLLEAACDLETSGNGDFVLETGKDYLLVTNSDFETGSLSVIDLDEQTAHNDLLFPHSDTNVVANSGNIYIISRFGSDSLTRVADDFSIVFDKSTGSQSNPHDMAFLDDDRALVSLYGKNEIAVMDTATGKIHTTISTGDYQDGDGIPELSALVRSGDFIFAAVQNLDRTDISWSPNGNGRLLQIDVTDLSISENAQMPYSNPFSDFQEYTNATDQSLLIFSCAGDYGGSDDGALLSYDTTSDSYTTLITEIAAGGFDLPAGLLTADDEGVVILSHKTNFETALARFDVASGEVRELLVDFGANKVKDLAFLNDRLYVAQATANNSGIRIFDTTTWQEITDGPIDTGLPPYSVAVLEN